MTDFGLARRMQSRGTDDFSVLAPESTVVMGTFGYVAPEYARTGEQHTWYHGMFRIQSVQRFQMQQAISTERWIGRKSFPQRCHAWLVAFRPAVSMTSLTEANCPCNAAYTGARGSSEGNCCVGAERLGCGETAVTLSTRCLAQGR